jgi:hypothetical protein
MSDQHSGLSPEDLKLLMGNFQNIIQMNTILVEQSKQLLAISRACSNRQENMVKDNSHVINQLKTISEKMEECANNLIATNKSVSESFKNMDGNFTKQLDSAATKHVSWEKDVAKQHTSINKNVYIAWIGMGTLVLGLVGLLVAAYERSTAVQEIYEIVEKLSQYFSLG